MSPDDFFSTHYSLLGFELLALVCLAAALGALLALVALRGGSRRPRGEVEKTTVALAAIELLLRRVQQSMRAPVARITVAWPGSGVHAVGPPSRPKPRHPRFLFVVRRERTDVFRILETVECPGLIDVAWDRRSGGERRRGGQAHEAEEADPDTPGARTAVPERRREARRQPPPPHSWDALGFILLEAAAEAPSVSPADHDVNALGTPPERAR